MILQIAAGIVLGYFCLLFLSVLFFGSIEFFFGEGGAERRGAFFAILVWLVCAIIFFNMK